jgi:hypothetical protein
VARRIIHNGTELPPPVDAETRARGRRALNIPDDAFVIAVIANLIPYKGHADLLAALGAVRNRLTVPWRLMLVGRDQGIGAPLQRQADELGIADGMMWLGERADSQALIAAADLGVVPSHQEGFSNSLIEHVLPQRASAVTSTPSSTARQGGWCQSPTLRRLARRSPHSRRTPACARGWGRRRGCGSKGRSRCKPVAAATSTSTAGLSSIKQSRSRSLLIHPKHASLSPQRPPSRADPAMNWRQQNIRLRRLEAEAIEILREAAVESHNPVMLYSIGKDSGAMLHLAQKAFAPGKPPFPLPRGASSPEPIAIPA